MGVEVIHIKSWKDGIFQSQGLMHVAQRLAVHSMNKHVIGAVHYCS